MPTYSEKLRDPRWQRKRLEIMQRDGFACVKCGNDRKTLNVHHTSYLAGRAPWDYPDSYLETQCEDCHAAEHGLTRNAPLRRVDPAPATTDALVRKVWILSALMPGLVREPYWGGLVLPVVVSRWLRTMREMQVPENASVAVVCEMLRAELPEDVAQLERDLRATGGWFLEMASGEIGLAFVTALDELHERLTQPNG